MFMSTSTLHAFIIALRYWCIWSFKAKLQNIAKKTWFTTYNLNKADFISLIQKAR